MQEQLDNLLSYKLHCVALHLADQELNYGPMCRVSEFWIERMIQYMKRVLSGRATNNLEACFVNDELMLEALRAWHARFPDHCKSVEEERKAEKARSRAAYSHNDRPTPGGHVLLGQGSTQAAAVRTHRDGTPLEAHWEVSPEEEWEMILADLQLDREYARKRGWPVADPDCVTDIDVLGGLDGDDDGLKRWRHARARLSSDVIVGSRQQLVSASRSNWVYAKFEDDDYPCMLDVLYCVRVEYKGRWPAEHHLTCADGTELGPPKPLRYVIARVFRADVVPPDTSAVTDRVSGISPEFLMVKDCRPEAAFKTLRAVSLDALEAPSPSLLMHEVQTADPATQVQEVRGVFMRTGKASAAWTERPDVAEQASGVRVPEDAQQDGRPYKVRDDDEA